jgi:hypothetical protein
MDNKKNKKLYFLVFALGFLIPLFFALYTGHAWEDWYITYKSSKNLAIGNGLVYMVGERVHTFTSPLGTLVPAFFVFITGNYSDDLALWLFRLFSCVLLGFSSLMLLSISNHFIKNSLATIFLISMFLFDLKTVDFSINGMETALMIFFLALLLYSQIMPLKRATLILGIAWAGLMWTRPDSFIYISAVSLGFLIFNPELPTHQRRSERLKQFLIAGLITSALYLPWLIFAWLYYGSPIPNTVVAKGLKFNSSETFNIFSTLKDIFLFPFYGLFSKTTLNKVFTPSYSVENRNLDFSPIYHYVSKILAWFATFAWVFPKVNSITKGLSFAVFFGHIYLGFIMQRAYPWYFPAVTFLSIVVLSLLVNQIFEKIETLSTTDNPENAKYKVIKMLFRQATIIPILLSLSLMVAGAYQVSIHQKVIELNHRKQIGLWLKENASPKDRVFSECLGYIGFYSELKMYDFPGLSSPEVVEARRKLQSNDYGKIINYLKPEWVVLRPNEVMNLSNEAAFEFSQNYTISKVFKSEDLNNYPSLSGKAIFRFDQIFFLYHINSSKKE